MTEKTTDFKIDWSSRSKMRGPGEGSLGELLIKLRDRFAPHAQGVSISYVDDRGMRKLNREHRGLNQTTDVLSFPSKIEKGAFPHLGDLVISLPTADKMAKKLGVSRRREVETLVIHGFLHLCGFDHEKDKGEMMELQAQVEQEFLEDEPLLMHPKRGRRPGSKVKQLKTGERVVVTGRAAQALIRKETDKVKEKRDKEKIKKEKAKLKAREKAKEKKLATKQKEPRRTVKASKAVVEQVKRGPGRPRKNPVEVEPSVKRVVRKKKTAVRRTGMLG